MEKKGVVLQIFGRVQGVGFRYYTQKKAAELGITGFVKNLPDGSVHVEAEANEDDLETFVDWCGIGPSWARVSRIDRQNAPPVGHQEFVIR